MENYNPLIIGGGPAGITTANQQSENKIKNTTIEQEKQVEGLCKTLEAFRHMLGEDIDLWSVDA